LAYLLTLPIFVTAAVASRIFRGLLFRLGRLYMTRFLSQICMQLFPSSQSFTNERRFLAHAAIGVSRHGMVCLLHRGKASLS
jgi:hypothetical protein